MGIGAMFGWGVVLGCVAVALILGVLALAAVMFGSVCGDDEDEEDAAWLAARKKGNRR